MADWQDGTRILLNKLEAYMSVDLQPKKKIMMKSLSNCSNSGFYRCFHEELTSQEFSTCPRKCFSISTFLNATPICKTKEEFQCAHDLARKLKKKQLAIQLVHRLHLTLHRNIKMKLANQVRNTI